MSIKVPTIGSQLFARTRRRVLGLLFANPDRRYHLRELIRLVRTGRGAVQRELENLVKAGLVTRVRDGNRVLYQANRLSPVFEDLQGLMEKTARQEVEEMLLGEMVRRIVGTVQPERIVLFGSRAREEAEPESDFDLLIVAPSDLPRWRRAAQLYGLLAGMGVGKDLVWVTPEEIAEWEGVSAHFINTALRQGVVLYERAA